MHKNRFITVSVLASLVWLVSCLSINNGELADSEISSSSAQSNSSSAVVKVTFTDDRDSNTYRIVKIGTQVWMAENLRYLPNVHGVEYSYDEPKYYVYEYTGARLAEAKTSSYYQKYGALYNWPAALEACPAGWHLPTNAEWSALEDYVGSNAGKKLKATSGWFNDSNGTDAYGIGLLPGGYFNGDYFYSEPFDGKWWSAAEGITYRASIRVLGYDSYTLGRGSPNSPSGLSVRCVEG